PPNIAAIATNPMNCTEETNSRLDGKLPSRRAFSSLRGVGLSVRCPLSAIYLCQRRDSLPRRALEDPHDHRRKRREQRDSRQYLHRKSEREKLQLLLHPSEHRQRQIDPHQQRDHRHSWAQFRITTEQTSQMLADNGGLGLARMVVKGLK